jgi:hypothetical protein
MTTGGLATSNFGDPSVFSSGEITSDIKPGPLDEVTPDAGEGSGEVVAIIGRGIAVVEE